MSITFEEAWEESGRQYGKEELENVRLGWEMALKAASEKPVAGFFGPYRFGPSETREGVFVVGKGFEEICTCESAETARRIAAALMVFNVATLAKGFEHE